jgi:structural maintenance of chromosome 1
LEGNLKNAPMEEVQHLHASPPSVPLMIESGVQPPKVIPNFGIEVDFSSLDEEDREVR